MGIVAPLCWWMCVCVCVCVCDYTVLYVEVCLPEWFYEHDSFYNYYIIKHKAWSSVFTGALRSQHLRRKVTKYMYSSTLLKYFLT